MTVPVLSLISMARVMSNKACMECMREFEKNRNNRLPDYNTALVSDPSFSRLPSSVVIMSISACKHKLVYTVSLNTSLCRATELCICMYDRGLSVALVYTMHCTNGIGEQHLCKIVYYRSNRCTT